MNEINNARNRTAPATELTTREGSEQSKHPQIFLYGSAGACPVITRGGISTPRTGGSRARVFPLRRRVITRPWGCVLIRRSGWGTRPRQPVRTAVRTAARRSPAGSGRGDPDALREQEEDADGGHRDGRRERDPG
ncbi:hypothetical protein Pve01_68980 [Planomonospora venezuelensis]|nr:hypothetical protein Pve01_68980 [Planomonospora venezuelensis]